MSKQKAIISPIILRVKAFIIDIFLISMPLLYCTTYLILNGKDDFQHNQLAIFIVWIIYGVITSIFYSLKAQTPGYKASEIYLINLKTGKKVSFLRAFFRYILFIISCAFVVGFLVCFFRKDRLNLHDVLTKTAPVKRKFKNDIN
ncbi:RDD family protein [Campylobacter sp. FMV-PI01]|uniref:RDD family protein n=1 Tax=Campylobacter portucalensis TaxID=2608384 RepID=A0A6L5WK45_9BACT|nr:RDD family protein [Campylobacter portucalensis]MSN96223.1 RDD family protein [Campylobacter portucalensis]